MQALQLLSPKGGRPRPALRPLRPREKPPGHVTRLLQGLELSCLPQHSTK